MAATGATTDTLYDRALALYELRQFAEAEAMLRKTLAREPNRASAHAFLALALLAQPAAAKARPERRQEALREAKRAVGLRPDAELGYLALGWACVSLRKADETLTAAAQALRVNPESEHGWWLQAEGWALRRDWRKMLQSAESGLKVAPRSVGLLNNRAYALISLDRPEEARAAVEQALARDPQSDSAHTYRAWLRLLEGDGAGALAGFREALRLDPLNDAARKGFLTALQARNPLYRGMVRYSLWTGRMTRGEAFAWMTMLSGIDNALRLAARAFFPLYLIYLPWSLCFALFAFFSWIADASFYLLLRFNPRGRLLLTDEEMAESNALAACVLYFMVNLGAAVALRDWGFVSGMVLAWMMMIPAAAVFKIPRRALGRRVSLAILTGVLGLTGLLAQALTLARTPWALLPWILFALGAFSLPWIANVMLLFD